MPYLLKSEPESYSYSDLERDGETTWDGVKNPQALMNLAGMKKGEKLVIYHTVTEKAAVGTAHVVSVDDNEPEKSDRANRAGQAAEASEDACGDARGAGLSRVTALSAVPALGGAADGCAV